MDHCRSKIEELEQRRSELLHTSQICANERQQLQKENKKLQEELNAARKDITVMHNLIKRVNVSQLQKENTELREALDDSKLVVVELREALESAHEEIERLKNQYLVKPKVYRA